MSWWSREMCESREGTFAPSMSLWCFSTSLDVKHQMRAERKRKLYLHLIPRFPRRGISGINKVAASGRGGGVFFGLVCCSGGGPASFDELFDGVILVLVGSSSQRRARREEQGRQQYQRFSASRRRQHHTSGTFRWVSSECSVRDGSA